MNNHRAAETQTLKLLFDILPFLMRKQKLIIKKINIHIFFRFKNNETKNEYDQKKHKRTKKIAN